MEQTVARQLDEAAACRPAVADLLLKKASYNVGVLRERGSARALEFQGRLMDLEFERTRAQTEAKAKTGELEPAPSHRLKELNAPPSLRQRSRMQVNEDIHSDLSEDLVQMVQKIRENAQRFNEKLETDRSVVDSAAAALQTASSSMTSVGSRLDRYRKSTALGWMFYVWAAAFIAGSLIVGMLLIQLFPKF